MNSPVISERPKLKNYFGKHIAFLRTFGVSLAQNESVVYKIYAFVMIFIFDISYVFLDYAELFKHHMDLIGDSIVYQFAVTMSLAKIIFTIRYGAKFRNIFDKLEQPPFIANPERGGHIEEELIKECLWITNFQTYMYWTLASFTLITGTAYALINRFRNNDFHELSYGPITLLNTTYSPNFEITCLYQGASLIHLALLFCTTDLILAGISAHISYQFKIFQNSLRRLVEIAYNKMLKDLNEPPNQIVTINTEIDGSKIPWKYLKEAANDAINYHLAIIDLANEIENTFSIFLLFIFLTTLIFVGFLTFRSSQMPIGSGRFVSSLGETACACVQVLIICYWGEEMVLQSEQVGIAAYEASFVGIDVRFQKFLVLIMRRSLNPTSITAGKFAQIRLTTYIWIMRSAYTAFMVLRKNNLENN